MKSVSRNKFLICFRPVVDIDMVLDSNGAVVGRSVSDPNLRYEAVENKEKMKVFSKSKSSVSDRSIHYSPKRRLSRMIKAVVFETILAKRSKSSFSSKRLLDASDNILEIIANSALPSSSSCSSSKSLSDIDKSMIDAKQKHKTQQDSAMKPKKMDIDYTAIRLFLISLAITVFWGRLCAILFTSIWLYFLPRRQSAGGRPETTRRVPETEYRENRKRIIMEGLFGSKSAQRPLNS